MMRFCGMLTILFVGLKLAGVIAWPWPLVVAPALSWLGITVLFLASVGLLACLIALAGSRR